MVRYLSFAVIFFIHIAGLGLFVALPLSLLRNIESLQIVCTTSILFYLLVVLRSYSPHTTRIGPRNRFFELRVDPESGPPTPRYLESRL